MKIRLKFTKQGRVKFVGHLDMIRLFQRALKITKLPIAYSQGFNPHSLVYFAMPLSVGVSSNGEYMDIITTSDCDVNEVKTKINAVLVEGISIVDAFEVDESSTSLMSLVQAAAYKIVIAKKDAVAQNIELIKRKLSEEQIITEKKGKKGIKTIDIKPMILNCEISETPEELLMHIQILAGSSTNLSPQVFLQAVLNVEDVEPLSVSISREELYTYSNNAYLSLDQYVRNE